MADHFVEVVGLRVSALEARVAAEAESVTQHFAELKDFVSFTVTSQLAHLRTDVRRDLRRVEQRLDRRIDAVERKVDALAERLDAFERKMDAHHAAMKLILSEILDRLPARGR